MRNWKSTAIFIAVLSWSVTAAADIKVTADPSPSFGATPLVFGDFPENAHGSNEHYNFNGEAQNTTAAPLHLQVSARANGGVIAGSTQEFVIPPGGSWTPFDYDFTRTGAPSPATVGVEFVCIDGTMNSIHGLFDAAPTPAVPASSLTTLGLLFAALLFSGAMLSKGRAMGRVLR
jgi:hypothetical protein